MDLCNEAAGLQIGAEPRRLDGRGIQRQRLPLQGDQKVIGIFRARGEA